MNQCVEEIEAEPDGDGESDDRLSHGARLLKLTEGEGVDAHQRQNRDSERHKRNVEHDRLLLGALLTPGPRKLSIPNRAPRNKDFVMKRAARTSFTGFARVGRGRVVKPRRTEVSQRNRSTWLAIGENIIDHMCKAASHV